MWKARYGFYLLLYAVFLLKTITIKAVCILKNIGQENDQLIVLILFVGWKNLKLKLILKKEQIN